MKEQIQIAGLCVNCLNADQCGYRVNHTKPIIFCEEFTCADPSESRNKIAGIVKKTEHPTNNTPKGICSNCEDIQICHLQKKNADVLYCEEYR
ncbi:hypothetical protein QUF75_10330 [Desulfococcaceae bacterium HSG7]|nr:hypothetical protein [Desulfococcaceae bacterium HSG7]